ncbi:MAG: PAS domain S-box protein [Oscillatoriales cyanobacterium]|uniref:Adenylate/guanylate cyclase domain-containing protein n=1 Tax=Microcoleus anatoxicus PTRS2 TaxID=2705321 RepID=A0ABU8YRY4_9CYAN|nr:MAG: PAS domain S-box protein [Oscillatoriales cyanobacterium]TAD93214.1 MAG: PAS domain S-box protein [Oscillatoriales cyanobacterium]TAE02468.1 MAG: PAS domain S-box protein [Oscillatoriales cyanobacterium]
MNLNLNQLSRFIQSINWQYLGKVAAIALVYILGAKLAVSIPGINKLATCVWPPAGIAQAALLLFGWRFWPGVALGVFFFEKIDMKVSLILSLVSAFCACLQSLCAFILLNKLKFRQSLDRLIDVVNLIFCGAVVATQINCTLGTLRLCLTGLVDWNQYWEIRWNWYLGDTLGVLIFAPLLLILYQKPAIADRQISSINRIWAGIGLMSLIAVSWVVYSSKATPTFSGYPLEYLPFPLVIWATIQFGQRGAVISSFLVSSIAIWGGSQGAGPFITKAQSINQAILFLQAFMSVIVITSLLLAATVAERASAEKALRQSEIKYRELVENANSIILKLDRVGNITFFNEFAQNFFGYEEEEILGKNAVGTIIPPTDTIGNDLTVKLRDILQNPEKYTRNENESIRRSGDRVWVSWANKPLFDEAGKFAGMLAIGTDITDRRRAEMELYKLNEELEFRVQERTNALNDTLSALRVQQEQSERLLLNILPQQIADRLKQGDSTIADTFADVTVLFADIVGFTQLSATVSPTELVALLNEIFSTFDHLAERHGLEKIKTIGDAYMVVGGLPIPCLDHAEKIAQMAIDMQQAITEFSKLHNQIFSIRIGINTGPVVAGVIGIKKFIYDLWGDTVNTASRMESHGLPGCIQVTSTTYHKLQAKYIFESRPAIEVKGKGLMNTYLLKGRNQY